MADKYDPNASYEYPSGAEEKTYKVGPMKGGTESMAKFMLSRMKDPKMLVLLFAPIILVSLVTWLISGVVPHKKAEVSKKLVSAPPPQLLARKPMQHQQVMPSPKPNNIAISDVDTIHEIGNHTETANDNKHKIDELSHKLDDIDGKYKELSANIHDMHYAMTLLSRNISDLKQSKIKKNTLKKRRIVRNKKPVLQHYSLKGAIYGRAWVLKKGGSAGGATVRVGDVVPTYGRVLAINPDDGIIKTSSGREIKYAASDS